MANKRRTKIYTDVTTIAGKTRADVRIVDQDTGEVISSYGSMGKDAEALRALLLILVGNSLERTKIKQKIMQKTK